MQPHVALIGFGEAGSRFAAAGGWQGHARGWDLLESRRAAMAGCGVQAGSDPADALAGAEIVLSLVTADQALKAAQDYAAHLAPGAVWCDMNSVAPGTKRAAQAVVEAAGGAYADVAVLAPVDQDLNAPLLVSGPAANRAREMLAAMGFTNVRVVGGEVGRASAIKMIRSVMIKGLEALTYECAEAANRAGVLDEVLASLDASEKPWGWGQKFAYNRERMETHGARRAAEMEEVCHTLQELGVEPVMTKGTVQRQRAAALRHV